MENWFETYRDHNLVVQTSKSSHATVGIGDGAFGRWLGAFFAIEADNITTHDLALELILEGSDKGWIK